MAEYIEREALLEKLAEHDLCLCVSESDIKNIPAADVAPVVHGRWRLVGECGFNDCYICSECGKIAMNDSNYCPNCGAKMDKEATDESLPNNL